MLTRIERNNAIEVLEKELSEAKGIFLTDFNGIDVEKMTKFRDDLRDAGGAYIVAKNTLARIALERAGIEGLESYLAGPTGIAIAKEDAVVPAKVITKFSKENKDLMPVKSAYVDGTIFDADQVKVLADLPTKDVLLAQLLSVMNAPVTKFAGTLGGILTNFVRTVDAVRAKKEQEA